MVRVEKMKNRIPFSQRLFWSIFVMFLGFTVCFLLFQYQREREFSQEKLNNVLSNYNYQLFSRTQQDTDINKTVRQFIEDIPQKNCVSPLSIPTEKSCSIIAGQKNSTTITIVAKCAKPVCIMKALPSAPRDRRADGIFIRPAI